MYPFCEIIICNMDEVYRKEETPDPFRYNILSCRVWHSLKPQLLPSGSPVLLTAYLHSWVLNLIRKLIKKKEKINKNKPENTLKPKPKTFLLDSFIDSAFPSTHLQHSCGLQWHSVTCHPPVSRTDVLTIL